MEGHDTWDAAPAASDAGDATRSTVARTPGARLTTTAPAVDEAMSAREAQAMSGFLRLVVGLCVMVLLCVPFMQTTAREGVLLCGGIAITLGGALYAWRRARRGPLSKVDTLVFGIACMIGGSGGVWYFGFYSPAAIITVMGIFFFGIQRSVTMAMVLYVSAALLHGGVMFAMAVGWIEDRGAMTGAGVSTRNKLVMVALVEFVFFVVLLLSRAVHRAILRASIQLEETTRAVAHREALLEEARRELEHALEVGGPGRFTEQRLGPWQLGVLCGRGAMGDVYEATRVPTGERAAVKLLTRAVSADKGQVRRFLREARIAASIDVPNVVRVVDVAGEEAPVPYIAMELLRGTDLAALLRRRRRLGADEAVAMLREVGRGLDAAHAAGVVHRDLKPQNLFHAEGEPAVWKLLDFGVSRVVDVDSSLTRGQAVGTPAYMSPEQARGHEVDKRGDLFALGVLAYRALVGRPAFTGREVPQILYRVVHSMPPRPSEVATDLPPAVDAVLAIALAKRPADRFESAGAFADAIEAALRGELRAEHAARAAALLARTPWGDRLEGAEPAA
jgi:serine/threonine-protein kinase